MVKVKPEPKPKPKGKGKASKQAKGNCIGTEGSSSELNATKLRVRRVIHTLANTPGLGRMDVACKESLEDMLPHLSTLVAKMEDSELSSTIPDSDIIGEYKTSVESGPLRLLADEVKYAEDRIARFA